MNNAQVIIFFFFFLELGIPIIVRNVLVVVLIASALVFSFIVSVNQRTGIPIFHFWKKGYS
jgi:hypothetical protein